MFDFDQSVLTFITRACFLIVQVSLPWLFAAFIAHRLLPLRHPLLAASTASIILHLYCWVAANVSTIKKCFKKAGFFSENESLVSFPEEHQKFDPFQELVDTR